MTACSDRRAKTVKAAGSSASSAAASPGTSSMIAQVPNAATGQPVQPDDDGALDDDRTDDGDTADADFPAGGAFGFRGLLGSGPSGVWVPVPGEGATGGDADGGAPALGFNTQAGGHFFGDDEPGGLDVAGTLFSGGLPFGGGDGDDGTSFPLAGDTDTFPLSGDTNTFPLGAGQSQTVTAGFFDLGGAPPAGAHRKRSHWLCHHELPRRRGRARRDRPEPARARNARWRVERRRR